MNRKNKKAQARDQKFKGILCIFLGAVTWLGFAIIGCGDGSLPQEVPGKKGENSSIQNVKATVPDFEGIWTGPIKGRASGLSGIITIDLSASGNTVGGNVDVSLVNNVPGDVTIVGTVGVVAEGVYSFFLQMNDLTAPLGCIGWNVIGFATIKGDYSIMDITFMGIFCSDNGVLGELGFSNGTLTKEG